MKLALVGIIKNEAHDILYWLGWHARLGINSFILFDDDSDDGTRALIRAACVHWDIRLFHIREHSLDLTEQSHLKRQQQVYCDALNAVKGQFDWVGLFDTDEYLTLCEHETLPDFLATMGTDVGAVALHWRVYGHNGHITAPTLPPSHSFIQHSMVEEAINRHVKCFIRPSYWDQKSWVNVHYFPLKKGQYVTASGKPVTWSAEAQGITAEQADWSVAFLRHFQNRSVEQFVERTRNRKDIHLNLADVNFSQWNELEDHSPRAVTASLLNWVRPVITSGAVSALEQLHRRHPPLTKHLPPSSTQNPSSFTIFALYPKEERHLGLKEGLIQDVEAQELEQHKNGVGLFMLQSRRVPTAAFLFALDQNHKIVDFALLGDGRLGGLPRYDLLPIMEQKAIVLRQKGGVSRRGYFLSAPPKEPLTTNRLKADMWECFTAIPQPTLPTGQSWLTFPALNLAEMLLTAPALTLEDISLLTALDRHITTWLLPLLAAHLDEAEARTLRSYLGPFAPFIL